MFCSFWFLFCFFNTKKTLFSPQKRAFFSIFSVVSLCFSLSRFLASLFFCFSFSVSLFSSFLSFFLLVFPFCFLLAPCFCLFLYFSFFFASLSWKEQHQNIKLQVLSSSICSLLFLVSCLSFLFQAPFSYLCYFLILSYVFCSTSKFLISKQTTLEKHHFLVKGGGATKLFFYQPVFWKMWKVIVFCVSLFWAKFGWSNSKSTMKIGISAHFKEQNIGKQWPFLIVTNWATLMVTNWATFVPL